MRRRRSALVGRRFRGLRVVEEVVEALAGHEDAPAQPHARDDAVVHEPVGESPRDAQQGSGLVNGDGERAIGIGHDGNMCDSPSPDATTTNSSVLARYAAHTATTSDRSLTSGLVR
jgi:hypothetical protein